MEVVVYLEAFASEGIMEVMECLKKRVGSLGRKGKWESDTRGI